MKVKIYAGRAAGKVTAPPSKSMAHRLLICGAMSEKSRIDGIEYSEDILATIDCLRALGATVETDGNCVTVGGLGPERFPENAELYCRESGSTLRFFIPLCLLSGKKSSLFGSERLLERPQSVYEELCRARGFEFVRGRDKITLCGKLEAGEYEVAGDISSQFITGLMFALSTLKGESKIKITGTAESLSYIKLTVKAFADFGVKIELTPHNEIIIAGGRPENRDLTVEGDYSNAAFFDALGTLGGDVEVLGLDDRSLQGDRVYKQLLGSPFAGTDLSDCPDLAPILFALAAANGGGSFVGTRRLKIKESDRSEAMREELSKFGITVKIGENSVDISGELKPPSETLYGHNDHRIVMALSVLCSKTGGVIEGAEAVAKSLPDFFERLNSLGIKTEVCSL